MSNSSTSPRTSPVTSPAARVEKRVRFVGLTNDAVRQGSFHPLPDGQRMMARIVSCYLDIFSSATDQGYQANELCDDRMRGT